MKCYFVIADIESPKFFRLFETEQAIDVVVSDEQVSEVHIVTELFYGS
jgi:hypothetical protein